MQFHILVLFSGISPPHFKQEESPFPSPFAKPFIGSTAYCLSAIRRFPFLAAKHSPSCRQRKRSLSFARDDDTGNVLPSFLLPCIGYSSRRPSFRAQREIFFVPFFPRLLRYAVYGKHRPHLFAIRCFPFPAVRHSPSYRQRKRSLGSARDDDTGNVLSQHNLFPIYGNAHFPPFY